MTSTRGGDVKRSWCRDTLSFNAAVACESRRRLEPVGTNEPNIGENRFGVATRAVVGVGGRARRCGRPPARPDDVNAGRRRQTLVVSRHIIV